MLNMKKILLLIALTTPFLFACNKDDGGSGPAVNYSGTYKGTITIQTNGATTGTLADYSITFTEQGGGIMTLTNSVFAANSGTVSGNTFTLTKKIIPASPTYNTEETGTTIFSGTNAVISFKEQDVDLTTGAASNIKTWTGTLIKQ
jgi:hypothetical protein